MKNRTILVVDLGTSKVHANLFEAKNGKLLINRSVSYGWERTAEGHVEISPRRIWTAAQEAVGAVITSADAPDIAALTFSFFGGALMTLDEKGEAVFPLIVSFDARAGKEAAQIKEKIPASELKCIVRGGIRDDANPAKVLWLKRNDPEKFEQVRYLATPEQYFCAKLELPLCGERSMIQTLQFHRQDGTLIMSLAEFCGISEKYFDYPIYDGNPLIGRISRFGIVELGQEVPVFFGGHDCILSQIGSGAMPENKGVLGDVCGTYDLMGFLVPSEEVRDRAEECLNTPLGGRLSFMFGDPAGAELDAAVQRLWGRCSGMFLNTLFRKAVFDGGHGGLWERDDWETLKKDPASLDRFGEMRVFESLVEEITFSLKESYLYLSEKNRGPFITVRAGGGASKSANWIQLKADVFRVAFEIMENEEISSLGAALIAAVAAGCHPDYQKAAEAMLRVSKRFTPQRAKQYEELFQRWKKGKEEAEWKN